MSSKTSNKINFYGINLESINLKNYLYKEKKDEGFDLKNYCGGYLYIHCCHHEFLVGKCRRRSSDGIRGYQKQEENLYRRNHGLTSHEKEIFWPIYDEFESELSKIRIKRIELELKFIQNHDNLSDAEAMAMLKQRWRLDSDELKFKQAYADKFI